MKEKRFSALIKNIVCFPLLAAALVPVLVFAQEVPSEQKSAQSMDEVVITATKIEELKKDVPASVQIISSEDIKNSAAKDAGGLITEAGIGHITNYGSDLTGSIEVRGLETSLFSSLQSRVLILVNGSRAGTINLAEIPADDIERIEIVKGPASVLYGSSAMGGVINIITKEGKAGFQGFAGVQAGSWNYWKASSGVSGKTGSFDYFVTAGRTSEDNFKTPVFGWRENSAYNDETASARVGYSLLNDGHISVGFQHWHGFDIGSPGATYAPDPDNYDDKQRDGADIAYKTDTFSAKYYLVRVKETSYGGMTSGPGYSNIFVSDEITQGASLQKTFLIGDHRITVGGQWDRIGDTTRSNTFGDVYEPNSQYDNYAVFSEGRLSLLNKKLLISAGLRYDYFQDAILSTPELPNVNTRTEDMDHLTARGGVVYKLTDSLDLKGNVGTAFRAPAPQELAADYTYMGTHTVGNSNLKPEQSTSYDAGIDYSKGLFKGDLTFFQTDFKDEIVNYFDMSRMVSTYKNLDGSTIQGLEFNSSYDLGPALGLNMFVTPFTNITYKTKYEDESGTNPTTLLNVPKWTGAFGLKVGQEKWDARLVANYIGPEKVTQWDYSLPTYGQTITKSGFTVLNLKGSYRPVKYLELTLSVQNLLDKNYAYNLGYPMPGMTIIGGAKWLF